MQRRPSVPSLFRQTPISNGKRRKPMSSEIAGQVICLQVRQPPSEVRAVLRHRMSGHANVLHVLKRLIPPARNGRWLAGAFGAVLGLAIVVYVLFVPVADWFASHDVGPAAGSLHETAVDNARGRLLTLGTGLLATGALLVTARSFTLSREGQNELGIPLIAEPVFLAMLHRGISHHPAGSGIGSL